MPYITRDKRAALDYIVDGLRAAERTPGELNYIISRLLHTYVYGNGGINYEKINVLIGVLGCAEREFYRTVAAPYEDEKRKANGDVLDTP
jgi:hypothetical protein